MTGEGAGPAPEHGLTRTNTDPCTTGGGGAQMILTPEARSRDPMRARATSKNARYPAEQGTKRYAVGTSGVMRGARSGIRMSGE